jgi:DnaK suppressor protein
MPSKKLNKAAKQPKKPHVKKPLSKAAAKKAARPVTKPKAVPVATKVPVKPSKTAIKALTSKATPVKSPAAKAVPTKDPKTSKVTLPNKVAQLKMTSPAKVPPTIKVPAAKVTPIAAKPVPSAKVAAKPAKPKAPVEEIPPVKFQIRPLVMPRPAAFDEDGDESGPANLLAGPRNVKPYVSRRGEQYMNKVQLDHFATILKSWKRDLMVEVDRTVLHMKDEAANFPDPNDRATQEEEFSLELRTRDRERKLIRKIDSALKRIEDGSYGYCLETGEEIGIKRLEARPVATLSVEAQERRERREKQYGDRDDRYR